MSPELEQKIHPRKVLAGAVAYYYQNFLNEAEVKNVVLDKNHKIVKGVRRFLKEYKVMMGGVMPMADEIRSFRDQTIQVADLQKEAKMKGMGKQEFIRANRGNGIDLGLLAESAHAWLIKSYDNQNGFLRNIMPIYLGGKYGIGQQFDRDPVDNAWASDMLMDPASDRIVGDIATKIPDREVSIEFGAGTGNFSKKLHKARSGIFSYVTDKNPKTLPSAQKNLEKAGLVLGKDFQLMQLDMCDVEKLRYVAEKLQGKKIIVHIGYILHEDRGLAQRTLKALSKAFLGMNVVFAFSEYYLQDQITEDTALHFQGLHYPTQDLYYRDEFFEDVQSSGFSAFIPKDEDWFESVHNFRGQTIVNSTTYWVL